MQYKDITGKRFSRLLVIGYAYTKDNRAYWNCKCDCGKEVIKPTNLLTKGTVKSCGCLRQEKRHLNTYKHGACKNNTETRLYKIWVNMKYRCNKPGNQMAKYYYDKGIRVCEEWQHDFNAFYKWAIESGYNDDLTIDRFDSNKNYCPENCRWATKEEQVINRHNINHFISYNGKNQTLSQWSRELHISRKCILNNINKGLSLDEIVRLKK